MVDVLQLDPRILLLHELGHRVFGLLEPEVGHLGEAGSEARESLHCGLRPRVLVLVEGD